MKIDTFFTPMGQIRSDCIVIFNYRSNSIPGSGNIQNLKAKPTYDGAMTKHGKKRLIARVDVYIQRNPPRKVMNVYSNKEFDFVGGFVTLTISSPVIQDHKKAYHHFKKFLRYLRERESVTDYIWKVELQKRGQPHYHLIVNEYIPFERLKTEWNKIQRKAGWLKEYAAKHKHYNAPSVNVKSIDTRKIRNTKAYLAKYISKSGKEKIDGKVWDSSETLDKTYYSFHMDQEQVQLVKMLQAQNKHASIEFDHAVIIKTKNPQYIFNESNDKEYKEKILA